MRTLTSHQDLILTKSDRSTFVRVTIDGIDMSDLEGYDWIKSVSYQSSLDANAADATIELFTQMEQMSLAPLMSGSKLNIPSTMLTLGAVVIIYIAVVPYGEQPVASDWITVFHGDIDIIDWQSTPLVLRCRDLGSRLIDRFIETQQVYPTDLLVQGNPKVENVIQQILDSTYGVSAITLYSISGTGGTPFNPTDSPGFAINRYVQQKQTVMQALRVLVDQIGWSIRYLWQANMGAFKLVLYDPGRELSSIGYMALTGQPGASETFSVNSVTFTAVTGTPTDNQFKIGTTVAETADNIRSALELAGTAGKSLWDATRLESKVVVWRGQQRTQGSMTFTGQPSDNETFVLNSTTYTAKTASPDSTNNEFLIGATKEDTVDNIVTAIRYSSENINVIAWHETSGSDAVLVVEWRGPPVDEGEDIVFTEALSNVTIDGSGTLGGRQAGEEHVYIMWYIRGTIGDTIAFIESLTNVTIPSGTGYLENFRSGRGAAVARTFGPSEYYAISNLSASRADIRNVVEVTFGRFADDRTTVVVKDQLSITAYGRRWCGIDEAATSQIDTEVEATDLATSVLDDLKDPDVEQSVEMPYFWPVELGDYYTFSANGFHFDTDIDLAVVSWSHSISQESARTTLSLRGKPAGGVARWLNLEARGGVGHKSDTYTAYEGVAPQVDPDIASFTLRYDDPRSMDPPIVDWAVIEVHISTTPDFTPSQATLSGRGRKTEFTVTGLSPGVTYYIKSRVIDVYGNKHNLGTQIQKATRKITPYYLSEDREYGTIVPNQEFSLWTLDPAVHMPDYWYDILGDYGESILQSTSIHKTGGASLHFDTSEHPAGSGSFFWEIRSEFIPVTEDSLYAMDMILRYAGTKPSSPTGEGMNFHFRLYGADKVTTDYINITGFAISNYDPDTWIFLRIRGLVPSDKLSGARFMKIGVFVFGDKSPTYATDYYIDRIRLFRDSHEFTAYLSSLQSVSTGTWTQLLFNAETFDYGSIYDHITTRKFIAPKKGRYRFEFQGYFAGLSVGTNYQIRFVHNTTSIPGPLIKTAVANNSEMLASTYISVLAGDTVHVEAWHDQPAASRNVDGFFKGRLTEYIGGD